MIIDIKKSALTQIIFPIEDALKIGDLKKVEEISDAYLTALNENNIKNPKKMLVDNLNYYIGNNKDWQNISKKYIK